MTSRPCYLAKSEPVIELLLMVAGTLHNSTFDGSLTASRSFEIMRRRTSRSLERLRMLRLLLSALPFGKLHDCARSTVAVAGGNGKASLACGFMMALPFWRRYTGMKLMASGAESSRSSATLTDFR